MSVLDTEPKIEIRIVADNIVVQTNRIDEEQYWWDSSAGGSLRISNGLRTCPHRWYLDPTAAAG